MKTRHRLHTSGSGLLLTLLSVAIIALLVTSYLQTIIPKYRSVYQGASWSEALQGAEGGANYAIRMLNVEAAAGRASAPNWASDWTGNSWTLQAGNYYQLGTALAIGGKDNASVSRLSIDTYTTNPASGDAWYRIRAEATANVPGRFLSLDRRDSELRHMNLSAKTAGVPTPYVKRVVEVILKPKYTFPMAIATVQGLDLGNSANWLVDSFDSSDSTKSDAGTAAGGVYPASAGKQQANGSIGTLATEPSGTTYGPLIAGNGAVVRGDVSTVGGDDPATVAHENVSGSGGMDQSRIFNTFDDEITAIAKPVWLSGVTPTPPGATGFSTSASKTSPLRYIINGNLGGFAVTAPASGTGYVQILVNGDLSGKIVIPPTVFATLYVDGNLDLKNNSVNSDNSSSQVATHLTVVGVSTAVNPTYSASGNGTAILAFYGPAYNVTLSGNITTIGAMVANSFSINGGGNGGFHYDEALGKTGMISSFAVASYFDDARTDVK